ncbi:MAG TPA: hypothetical protein VHU84_00250, partial [Lacipirellulaceae bacterium]|nr:hypothetical protein [Lacipirellulaceae bacterium]
MIAVAIGDKREALSVRRPRWIFRVTAVEEIELWLILRTKRGEPDVMFLDISDPPVIGDSRIIAFSYLGRLT